MRILAGIGLLLVCLTFGIVAADTAGLISTEPAGSPQDPPPSAAARAGAAAPDETVHAVGAIAVLVIGASGLGRLVARPARASAAYHVLSSMAGLLLTVPIVGDPDNFGGQAGPIDPVFVVVALPCVVGALLARPWRARAVAGGVRLRLLALAAVGAVPAAVYGIDQALMQRNSFPPSADPHHNAHWWVMSVFVFTVVLVLLASAAGRPGWRWSAATGSVGILAVGAASLLAPSAASALGTAWGAAAIAGGLAGLWFVRPGSQAGGTGTGTVAARAA